MTPVPAYAVAWLRNVELHDGKPCDDIIRYMREIDDTMTPFGGEFLIHGGEIDVREGNWGDGALVVIRFPDLESATQWYDSDGYRRILPLRTGHADSDTALVRGVAAGHTGAKRAAELLEEAALCCEPDPGNLGRT